MTASYWTRTVLSRRRLLRGAAAGAGGVAALSLLSCGGGGEGGPEAAGAGLVEPEDATKQAKRGGIYADYAAGDETNLDPFTTDSRRGFGRLREGRLPEADQEKEFAGGSKAQVFEGDAVESSSWRRTV